MREWAEVSHSFRSHFTACGVSMILLVVIVILGPGPPGHEVMG